MGDAGRGVSGLGRPGVERSLDPGARPPHPPPPPPLSSLLCSALGRARRNGNWKQKAYRAFLFLNRVSRSRKSTPNFPRTRYDHQLPTSGLSRVAAALVTLTRAPNSQQPSPHLRAGGGGGGGDGLPGKPPSSPGAAVGEPAPRASSEHVPAAAVPARAAPGRRARKQAAPRERWRAGRAVAGVPQEDCPPLRTRSAWRRPAEPQPPLTRGPRCLRPAAHGPLHPRLLIARLGAAGLGAEVT